MWHKEMIETERGSFEVFTAGEGDPICITHLYSEFDERGNYFADHFIRLFRVYLVNLKNAGNSSRTVNEEELSLVETSKDLEAVRKALKLRKWAFAGHSAGGMLGLSYASFFSTSITKMLIGGTAASKEYIEHKDSIYCSEHPINPRLKELLAIMKSNTSTREQRVIAGREWTEMSLFDPSKFNDYFSTPSSGRVVQSRLDYFSFKELPSYDLREKIKLINIPTQIYCGRFDSQCPLIFSLEIQNLISTSNLVIFEKSNHNPFLEEKEYFAQMVDQFYRT
ncbi:alpha/beta fold hydrolase [Alkalihalobacterium chitinilyticum]|uniref:Alpha/beta hydrolase n=1 Tax=Alkalihalobacterium chitinilyticum TaxID=2980103 RepID=A0ABT5VCY5_9BACI|nr:alpha/beta hydrolase [Alkalihalobacterium chitinilyticum]MDE5413304.1 alpha/beta hydrolase [Alkalihalobacterium chitinilyticum]